MHIEGMTRLSVTVRSSCSDVKLQPEERTKIDDAAAVRVGFFHIRGCLMYRKIYRMINGIKNAHGASVRSPIFTRHVNR